MRPGYYRFRRGAGWRGDLDITGRREPPGVSARRSVRREARANGSVPASDDRSPSPRIQEAAARLRSGDSDAGRIADLTGVPAALVELMMDTAGAEANSPSARGGAPGKRLVAGSGGRTSSRLLGAVVLLSASAFGCSLAAVATGRPMIGQLGAVAAVLALLVKRLGYGPAGRPPRGR